MRVLWLCNIKLPIVSKLQNDSPSPYGGWLDQVSKDIIKLGYELCIVYPYEKSEEGQEENFNFCSFTGEKIEKRFKDILYMFDPDVVHIWGTEFKHSYIMTECLKASGMISKGVISIQGLVSICAEHYFNNLPWKVVHGFTLRDLIKKENVYIAMKNFRKRGKYEIKAIQNIKHIIGRTDWDKACTEIINSQAHYHHCNETLRESFYQAKWSLESCERYSIFVSQASYPIKGFHILLEALTEVVKRFPETKVYVAGIDPTYLNAVWKDRLRRTYYGKYLVELMTKSDLCEKVIFTGPLNESQMRDRYLKSHVFVSTSSIENSPNSVGEAMLLGMPCVSSYVGGVANMLVDKEEGFLYQADAPYMLAYYVNKIFGDDDLAADIGTKAREHALKTHNIDTNFSQLLKIYRQVITGDIINIETNRGII
jgi:glycosyltransferase involved in cell wall biosynthesis